MTPDQVRKQVQDAYSKAMEARNTQWSHTSGIPHLFRDVRLYGREAGIDFVDTHLADIVREAIEAAQRKRPSLPMALHGFGRAAVAGMREALQERTGLKVDLRGSTIELDWA